MAVTVTPEIVITIKDLTSGVPTGSGVFDALMRTTAAQLQTEYSAGRITGGDYATVYTQTMNAVLQTAVQFTMSKDRVGYDIEMIKAQTASELERGGYR
jgi:hypothetical protein